jgi:hypothetical protein
MEAVKKEKKVRNSRSMFIIQWWNEGIKDKLAIAKKLQEIETNGTLPQKKADIVRDDAFYVRVANWYVVQLAKSKKIDYEVKLRKPRAPKEASVCVPSEAQVAFDAAPHNEPSSEETLVPTL